jgi:hypothetical protein
MLTDVSCTYGLPIHTFMVFKKMQISFFIFIYFDCEWAFTQWQCYYNKTQHTQPTSHKITPGSNKTQHTKLHEK